MAAALRFFFLLLSLGLFVSTSSRSTLPQTPSSPQASSNPSFGPIKEIDGKYYTYVCDPNRFEDLGLDIQEFAYCNKELPFADRVKDLISRMTLDEKIGQMGNAAQGVRRLGLPPYNWWSEALHGVSNQGPGANFNGDIKAATSFPTVILTTSSFNESLWTAIGQVVSNEARAMYNHGQAGLTFWSPNINVVRDPRWGRILETPGEDPFVVGTYAASYVKALQTIEGAPPSQDPNTRPMKISACCKHFAAYDVDNWFGVIREGYDARVHEQDMVETFLRPFEMCVKDGDVSSVMCSYNRVNGIPACADPRLLSQTIRGEWDLHGYIVSDCDSIKEMVVQHKWLGDTGIEAVSQVLRAGLDLDCGDYYTDFTGPAVSQGKVREEDIDNALKNLYTVLFRLGYFDGNPQYESLGKDDVCTKESVDLAAEAAKQGIVLLKNNQTLPLSKEKYPKIALVGPHANATNVMIGNYAGVPCGFVSPYDAFSQEADVDFVEGVSVWCLSKDYRSDAMKAAANADATIIVGGLEQRIEWESLDRSDLKMPGYQEEYINEVANAATGPVVLVIMSAGGIDITFAKNNPKIGAIIWAGYPGAEGGRAIADVIYGRYNPGGRLPITWYQSDYADSLPMTSMQLRPVDELGFPGRTYKFFNGSVVYPFGYGLSYTQFKYTIKSTPKPVTVPLGPHQHCRTVTYAAGAVAPSCAATDVADINCEGEISFEIEVANTGKVDGSDVVLVYSKAPANIVGAPIKQLVAFKRVFVEAGNSKKVKFTLNVCKSLSLVDKSAYVVLPSGEHTLVIGNDDEAVSFPVNVGFQ